MTTRELLKVLGYTDSPHFVQGDKLARAGELSHLLRVAQQACGLAGTYLLESPDKGVPKIPVVYVCEASSTDEADRIHRLVWNQNVVPFVIVHTPHLVRLYSGFRYIRGEK